MRFTPRAAPAMMPDTMGALQPADLRLSRRDYVIAAVVSAVGVALMVSNVQRLTDGIPPTADEHSYLEFGNLFPYWLALPLFLLVTVPVLWRRTAPLPAIGAAFLGLALNEALLGTEYLRCGAVLIVSFLLTYAAAAGLPRRGALVGLAGALALMALSLFIEFGPGMTAFFSAVILVIWGFGRLAGWQGRMSSTLEDRTDELHRVREASTRQAVDAERLKLALDLETVLHTRLGELAALAEDASRADDPVVAAAALAEIETTSRDTLARMRAILGVLRDEGDAAPTGPPPTLAHLEALLIRQRGPSAQLRVEGYARPLPAAIELSAYRVVEQMLHSLGDSAAGDVHVHFTDATLKLSVAGPASPDARASIGRVRERVRLNRGTLDATLRSGTVQAVASLPLVVA